MSIDTRISIRAYKISAFRVNDELMLKAYSAKPIRSGQQAGARKITNLFNRREDTHTED
jgi:hypothetical protein